MEEFAPSSRRRFNSTLGNNQLLKDYDGEYMDFENIFSDPCFGESSQKSSGSPSNYLQSKADKCQQAAILAKLQ